MFHLLNTNAELEFLQRFSTCRLKVPRVNLVKQKRLIDTDPHDIERFKIRRPSNPSTVSAKTSPANLSSRKAAD